MRLKANLLLFMVSVIWGTAFVAQGIAGKYKVAYLFNGISFILAALILVPFIPHGSKVSKDQRKWMLLAILILFVASAKQQVGLLCTKVANASFLTSLCAGFTPFLLWVSFREEPHWLDLIAVTLAGIGAYLPSAAGRFEIQPGDSIELAGALFWVLHFVAFGKFASRFESIFFTLTLLWAILYRATFSIGIGHTLQVWGLNNTHPTDAAVILGLAAVFAVFAAWVLPGQFLLPVKIFGCVIIFAGVLISQLKSWNSRKIGQDHLVEGRY